jgi:hypothetical protein
LVLLGQSTLALYMGVAGTVVPDTLLDNPRALRLVEKDVLEEIRWAYKVTLALRDFADAIDYAWLTGQTWPDKPSLPARPAKRKTLEERLRALKR